MEEAVRSVGLAAETRSFQPHLTLGRSKRRPVGLDEERRRASGDFAVDEAVIYESIPGRDGPRYATLVRVPLGGSADGPGEPRPR